MTTAQLAKRYSVPAPSERFTLVAAAFDRKDNQEVDRLLASAGRLPRSILDISPRLLGFHVLATRQRQLTLELAGLYLADRMLSFAYNPATEQKRWEELAVRVRLGAYLLQVHLQGWNQFCDKLGVPPHFSLDDNDTDAGNALLARAKEQLANTTYLIPPTEAEASELIARERLGELSSLITADLVEEGLRQEFDAFVKKLT